MSLKEEDRITLVGLYWTKVEHSTYGRVKVKTIQLFPG